LVSFDLNILGSSSALPTVKRFPTAHLLKVDERFFLIDCGEGTQVQLRKFGHNPSRIHHIFISHLHGDHVFGLFGLLSTLGMLGRRVALNLYGPDTLEPMMKQHFSYFGSLPFEINYISPDRDGGGFIFEDDRITVTPIPLKHRTTCYGYLFKEKSKALNMRKERIAEYGLGIADVVQIKQGTDYVTTNGEVIPNKLLTQAPFKPRSYAYISDTVFDPSISEKVKNVDLLFHEATFAEKDKKLAKSTLHSTARQAATVAKEAGARKLLIGHFSSRYKDSALLVEEAKTVFEATFGVIDGECYSVDQSRVTTE
jgi:ribonuclease Z